MEGSWIAVDWGTSSLRAWLMPEGGGPREPLAEAASGEGAASLAPDGFGPALLRLVGPWLDGADQARPVQALVSGMAGRRGGWAEAPYLDPPAGAPELAAALVPAPSPDPRLRARIVPGLRQADPPEVMRGEEVQLLGAAALHPGFAGFACLPGTHAKWARLDADGCGRFVTFMTGELFALLTERSTLALALSDGASDPGGVDGPSFERAAQEALVDPTSTWRKLFGLRAAKLLRDTPAAEARGRLSGLLVGTEVALAPGPLTARVLVIGAPEVTELYLEALAFAGRPAKALDAGLAARAGLAAVRAATPEGAGGETVKRGFFRRRR